MSDTLRTVYPDGTSRPRWPSKDPDEILDYDIDWTKRLYSEAERAQYDAAITANPALIDSVPSTVVMASDTLSTSTFTLPAGTLVANTTSNTTTRSKVWLAGGDVGLRYDVLNRITTAGGRRMDQTVKLRLKSK